MEKENVPWPVADLMRNAREAETELLGMWMAWDGFWTYGWGPGRALSAVSCLMDISREEELAFEIQMAGELVIPLRLSAAITWGNSSLRLR